MKVVDTVHIERKPLPGGSDFVFTRVESQPHFAFLRFLSVSDQIHCNISVQTVWTHKATMQLDPLAEAYRIFVIICHFTGWCLLYQIIINIWTRLQMFKKRVWGVRKVELYWLRLIYKVCICGQGGKILFFAVWVILILHLPNGTNYSTHLVGRKWNRPHLSLSE